MRSISKANQRTSKWAGGETTELYIYPESTDFKKGDFQFRLSTATVEVDESTFTKLPDVKRTLMLLKGRMELNHANHHNVMLEPFEVDEFEGDWDTKSIGQCVDLNLMCKGEVSGNLRDLKILKNDDRNIGLKGEFSFIYIFEGNLAISGGHYGSGDLLIFSEVDSIHISAKERCKLVLIEVYNLSS